MNDEAENSQEEDGGADALSAVVLIVIPVLAVIYWLSGMPVS